MSYQLGEATVTGVPLEPSDEQRAAMADDYGMIGGDQYLSTPKVVDYKIVEAKSVLDLQAEVHKLLREGYEPQGGLCVTVSRSEQGAPRVTYEHYFYHQAMVLWGLVD